MRGKYLYIVNWYMQTRSTKHFALSRGKVKYYIIFDVRIYFHKMKEVVNLNCLA